MTNLFLLYWTSLCNNTFWFFSYLHVANSFKYTENNFIVSSFSLTTNYTICGLSTFPLSSLACLFIFEISISIPNIEARTSVYMSSVHYVTSSANRNNIFITLITLSSMLYTNYIPNVCLITCSKAQGPFVSGPDPQHSHS